MNAIEPLAFMASVEGYQRIENIIPMLKEKGVTRVWLMPFMVVAGDHARNDLAATSLIPGLPCSGRKA